jgi:hypothetical protein
VVTTLREPDIDLRAGRSDGALVQGLLDEPAVGNDVVVVGHVAESARMSGSSQNFEDGLRDLKVTQ